MSEEELAKLFANNIKRLMNARGMSQTELADAASMHEPGISRVLSASNTPSGAMISKMANAFNVQPTEFFKPCGEIELISNGRKK